MAVLLIVVAGIILGNGLMLVVLARQFRMPVTGACPTGPEGRIQNYAPMLRLIDRDDLRFLRAQPGFTRKMESRFRRQRAMLFFVYLRSLEAEFGESCRALKGVMAQAAMDRPDLARLMVRTQVRFAVRLSVVRIRVVLYRWGVGRPEVAGLLQPFEVVREALQSLTPAAPLVQAQLTAR